MNDGSDVGAGFFVAILVVLFLAIAFWAGGLRKESGIRNSCNLFGAVEIQDAVFDCKKRPAPAHAGDSNG